MSTPVFEPRVKKATAENLLPNQSRIRDTDGFVGTVVYVGPVASAKDGDEIYAGVVWDDETRGKHDGTVICRRSNALVRHFGCCGATAGSFLRLSKVDMGVEMDKELLASRYVTPEAELVAPNNLLPHVALTASGRDKKIEFLGELKIRARQQVADLEEASLRSMGISTISHCLGDDESTARLRELDLAGNLLGEWNSVLLLLRQLPGLERVSLASNRIRDVPNDAKPNVAEFPNIRVLNLNNCSIRSANTLFILGQAMPNLEELCVAHSDLSDLATTSFSQGDTISDFTRLPGFSNLKLLDCSNCNITSWDTQVCKVRFLPSLESLILNDNPIPHIYPPESDHCEFQALSQLQLAGTAITSWTAIDALACFPTLRALRFRNNPLTATIGAGEARATIIARLPQIESLNASSITARERTDAERRYVSAIAREMLMIGTNMPQLQTSGSEDRQHSAALPQQQDTLDMQKSKLLAQNPRFQDLITKHKDAMMLVTESLKSGGGSLAHGAVNVSIRSMVAASCTMEPLQKRLPGNLKVGRLKIMIARAFGLEVELQILHYRSQGDPFPTELDDEENTLAYYGISDGAEILMNEIDVNAKKRDDAREVHRLHQRIQKQERNVSMLQAMEKEGHRAEVIATEMASNRLSKT